MNILKTVLKTGLLLTMGINIAYANAMMGTPKDAQKTETSENHATEIKKDKAPTLHNNKTTPTVLNTQTETPKTDNTNTQTSTD